ncbi:MAG: HisA/HisF-related TIM barrel protein [Thermoplasmata archaeon]|nr:HisA/HisF-related TIM barrel protein [Thermoplasmata archaeon]
MNPPAPAVPSGPVLMPCLMLRHGHVMLPAEGGPKVARSAGGQPLDVLDLADRLAAQYPRLYVVDLDGIEKEQPQLDYLQEISRTIEIWVDSGIRTADQAIDTIVAGAQRAILSSAYLLEGKEVRRAWKLSPEIAIELEVRSGRVTAQATDWNGLTPLEVAAQIREVGPQEILLGFRDGPTDWTIVRELAVGGPTFVEGSFDLPSRSTLQQANAAGGIFHIGTILDTLPPTAT